MLTQMLFLAAIWLELSLITLFLRGAKPQKGGWYRSVPWFVTIVLAGLIWALFSFAQGREILGFTAFSILFGLYWIFKLRDWNGLAHAFWISALLTAMLYILYSFGIAAFTPLHPLTFIAALFLSFIEAIALILALSFGFESIDVLSRVRWHRRFEPLKPIEDFTPIVSLHLPTYNEPIEIVERTLRSLAGLDYPYFEVLVVDISSAGEAHWQALAKLCSELGPGFRFFHLDNWPGFKLGALNFALSQTHPQAKVLGVVDADYLVAPQFLKELVPYFAELSVAFVQTPKNYHDYQGNPYLEYAYKYFYTVSMPSRNEVNAIVFAGPTGLISRRALQEIGGWDEWSMTEDVEASLHILKLGYQSVYVNKSYGTGLLPLSFEGLKRQRFRWAFGAMQILKKHWASLMPWSHWTEPKNHLSMAQRYFYLMGSLQWLNEPLNLAFTAFLILGSILAFLPANNTVRPFTVPLIVMPVFFLLLGSWRFLWILRNTMGFTIRGILQALARSYILAWTVTLACIQGILQPTAPIKGRPKRQSRFGLVRAIQGTHWQTGVGLACALLAFLVNFIIPQPASLAISALLVWQSFLYLSASYTEASNAKAQHLPNLPRRELETGDKIAQQHRVARVLLGVLLALLVGMGASFFMPAPTETPDYARFQPPNVQMQSWAVFPGSADTILGETPTAMQMEALALTATLMPMETLMQTNTAMPSPTVTSSLTPGRTPLATFVFATATPSSTPTWTSDGYVVPTATPAAPSPVPVLPTATPISALPTASSIVASATHLPATAVPVVLTATHIPATAVPPTPIPIQPTAVLPTPIPIQPTAVPPTIPPILTTVAPILTTVAPIISTTVPILTTVAPIVRTTVPIVTTVAPVLTTAAPILTTVAPSPRPTNEPHDTHEPHPTNEPRDTREPRPTHEAH